MNIKTIFFDVYQTLLSVDFDKDEKAWNVFSKFLNDRGVLIDAPEFQKLLEQEKKKYYSSADDPARKVRHHNLFDSIDAVFGNCGVEAEKKELLDLIWKFRQVHSSAAKLYPGIKEMLRELSSEYTLAIASYAQSSYIFKELEKLGIVKYFSHFIFSSDIGCRKTDPEFFKICLQKTKNEPGECLMVGDNYLQDVLVPKKIGLKAVLVRNPSTDKQNVIGSVKPDGIVKIKEIVSLPAVIQSIS